ncbi:hypothetical protein ACMD2_01752 [Ananas comosus]|uniref:Uncharacterized protein n=1 Tax=Ananas comosus TaxID=4615 RepID=A0A199VJH8_ANACO|nr:hypothetical protein ACMD2_01752 [Ananas comosus]
MELAHLDPTSFMCLMTCSESIFGFLWLTRIRSCGDYIPRVEKRDRGLKIRQICIDEVYISDNKVNSSSGDAHQNYLPLQGGDRRYPYSDAYAEGL